MPRHCILIHQLRPLFCIEDTLFFPPLSYIWDQSSSREGSPGFNIVVVPFRFCFDSLGEVRFFLD